MKRRERDRETAGAARLLAGDDLAVLHAVSGWWRRSPCLLIKFAHHSDRTAYVAVVCRCGPVVVGAVVAARVPEASWCVVEQVRTCTCFSSWLMVLEV